MSAMKTIAMQAGAAFGDALADAFVSATPVNAVAELSRAVGIQAFAKAVGLAAPAGGVDAR